ncbi:HAD domain-containing protein [Brevibacterium oceani]|uniref:HAD domain-containing protein n=1 Tax=Brevibacterium oceani TaxID=358099 RepID=UPI0015E73854|nr:HAD domain-containing protein [Brevibacterium oceani]
MPTITIACDVDGVLAPVTLADPAPGCIELPRVNHGTQVLTRVVAALKGWHAAGAEVLWHTTWRSPYTDDLERTLSLPRFGHLASEDEFLRPDPPRSWWKLAAVERWLRDAPDDARLVWIDDDIDDAIVAGEVAGQTLRDPRLRIISPDSGAGLTAVEIDLVSSLVRARTDGLVVG